MRSHEKPSGARNPSIQSMIARFELRLVVSNATSDDKISRTRPVSMKTSCSDTGRLSLAGPPSASARRGAGSIPAPLWARTLARGDIDRPRRRRATGNQEKAMRQAWKRASALGFAAALTAAPALAQELKIGLSAEPTSIDPHFHNLKIGRAH